MILAYNHQQEYWLAHVQLQFTLDLSSTVHIIRQQLNYLITYNRIFNMFSLTEIKEAHKRKKIMRERFKQEDNIASAMVIWVNEILPNWEGM